MKHKMKIFSLYTLLTVMLILSSCGKDTSKPAQDSNMPDDVGDSIQELPAVENDVDSDAEVPGMKEPEMEESVRTLHVMKGNYYENHWSEALSKTLARAVYPEIRLDSCCEQDFPELAQAINTLNEEEKNRVLTEYEALLESAESEIEYDAESFQIYEIEEGISVRRADSRVISLLYDGYSYSGGIHGMPYYWSGNFDTKTGEKLELSDVVTDVSVLPELVMQQFEKYGKLEDLYPELDLNEYFNSYPDGFSWVLDYNGITLFFDPYAIGPYASGTQIATISYAEHPELVKEEYQKIPESYGVELNNYNPFYYDLDNDGSLDELLVYGMTDEYSTYQSHSITINGMNAEFEAYSYNMDPMLIHTVDGKNYLYIQDTSDNDWRMLNVYDLSDGYVEKAGSIDAGWHTVLSDREDYFALEQVVTDPADFRLDTRTYTLSTMSGYLNYHIGPDGMPVTDEKWYVIGDERYFTLLQSLDVEIIDEVTGERIGETTLQTGDEVLYYRTNDELFADLKLSDGSVARVRVDQTVWPYCVDGIPIEELFDGIIFAG